MDFGSIFVGQNVIVILKDSNFQAVECTVIEKSTVASGDRIKVDPLPDLLSTQWVEPEDVFPIGIEAKQDIYDRLGVVIEAKKTELDQTLVSEQDKLDIEPKV